MTEKKVTGLLVKVDGSVSEVEVDQTKSPYVETQAIIGAWTERVSVLQVGQQMMSMWVDEMGHLKRLPINEKASAFYPAEGLGLMPGAPPIVGDVVFLLLDLVYDEDGPDWMVAEMTEDALIALRVRGVSLG